MKEIDKVTFQGNPLTLIGDNELKVADKLPKGLVLIANDLSAVELDKVEGAKIITTFPSIDTPVCDMQVKKFNENASDMGAKVFAVSADLPFAQARWCAASGVKNLSVVSDHASMNLANAFGIHIKELRLFARTVFVLNAENEIVYREIVKEVTSQPDFDAALRAVKDIA